MPDSKISALPSATVPLAGTEVLPVVQGGTTDKVTAADLLRQNGQTVTTSNPVLSLAQTWNAGGVTFTGLKLNVTDTASAAPSILLDLQVGGVSQFKVTKAGSVTAAGVILGPDGDATNPGFAFSAQTGVGLIRYGTNLMHVVLNGGSRVGFDANNNLGLRSDGALSWSSNTVPTTAGDTILVRDAANTLALRNSTNAQTFNVYNTYTSGSVYERFSIVGNGSNIDIGTYQVGTTTRPLRFVVGGSAIWSISNGGHFLAVTDNVYDIGASGATRPRSVYAGTNFIVTGAGSYNWDSRSVMSSPSDGVIRLTNAAVTDFTRLQFGGTTSSFPSIKRTGASLEVQLADGSGYAPLYASALLATGSLSGWIGNAPTAGGTAGRGLLLSSTANFGVFFGSGAPTLSAAKGSLYLRSDGSGTGDRMYVNTDGSTTWTAVTTAA